MYNIFALLGILRYIHVHHLLGRENYPAGMQDSDVH